MDQQFITETEFGESNFGKRLNYDRPKYRDPVFAVLYILHVIAVLSIGSYIWVQEYPNISNDVSFNIDFDMTGVILAICACILMGVLFGLFWLQIMKRFASSIIKGMLFLNIGLWVVVALIGLAFPGGIFLVVIGIVLALFYCLYTWCIWSRIPFASALLSIASTIISRYQGTIFLSLAVIVFNILWIIIWISCFAGYMALSSKADGVDEWGNTTYKEPSTGVMFLLCVSLYWGCQVNKNISHTTTCGVAATWYFSTVIDHKPTPAAFKRTMTTSFGSVCLGSLIVAILQALRSMLRNAKGRNALIALVAMCLLACIESLIRYFNKYAYAQCAIYGTSFVQSAKATWNLFTSRGILAIINDDLTGMAIMCGAFIGAVVSAGTGFGIGYLYYWNSDKVDNDTSIAITSALAGYGFFIGFVLCFCVLMVLASAVIALFVCYAEDPAAMNQNRPEEYNRLTGAKPEWGNVMQFNVGPRQPVAQQGGPKIFEPTVETTPTQNV